MMHIRKSALNALIISALVAIAALALTLTGTALRFSFGAGVTVAYTALWLTILAVVVFSFLFGWARYDAWSGLTLGIAALHDQLLSLALASILSIFFGLGSAMPALLVAGIAFTYLFTIPVLREARTVGKATSLREMSREEVAALAVKNTRPLRLLTLAVAVLGLLAFILSGNLSMIGGVLPLLTGLAAALLSSCFITPYVWAAFISRRKGKR